MRRVVALLVGLLVALSASPAGAKASGRLDPSFGTRGEVLTNFTGTDAGDGAYALAIQSDGKIVAAGFHGSAGTFALARYNSNGSLDSSFGIGGKVLTDFGVFGAIVYDVAIQSDGRIVAGGTAGYEFALARYNSDGSLDTSFGTGGEVHTRFGIDSIAAANALAIQPDGKIVAAGFSHCASCSQGPVVTTDFALARYNTHGHLDTSFGTEGRVLIDFSGTGSADTANDVAIQTDGKIVAAGVSSEGGPEEFALARYNSDGSLDASFGTGGKVLTGFSHWFNQARAVAIQSDGKIVAAGYSEPASEPSLDFTIVRYNSDGTLDASFGSGGEAFTGFGIGGSSACFGVVIQPDGKLVAAGAGTPTAGGSAEFAVARYNSDGNLDMAFGSHGEVLTDFSGAGSQDQAFDVAIEPDGKIVAAGLSVESLSQDFPRFALARYRA